MYYVPVSVSEPRWLRARLGTVVASSPLQETPWVRGVRQDGVAWSPEGSRSRDLENRSKSICECTCPRESWTPK